MEPVKKQTLEDFRDEKLRAFNKEIEIIGHGWPIARFVRVFGDVVRDDEQIVQYGFEYRRFRCLACDFRGCTHNMLRHVNSATHRRRLPVFLKQFEN